MTYTIHFTSQLGKSVVSSQNLAAGRVLVASDMSIKVSEPQGAPGQLFYSFVGRKLKTDLKQDDLIQEQDLE